MSIVYGWRGQGYDRYTVHSCITIGYYLLLCTTSSAFLVDTYAVLLPWSTYFHQTVFVLLHDTVA